MIRERLCFFLGFPTGSIHAVHVVNGIAPHAHAAGVKLGVAPIGNILIEIRPHNRACGGIDGSMPRAGNLAAEIARTIFEILVTISEPPAE